jgi:serine/threonine protein kinase
MLHLDLKPSNIIVEHGRTKLIDFSVSRRPGAGHRGAGTRQFMSPEQARGARVTEATDVWGIGAVLFSAAAGRPPFHAQRDGGHEQLSRRAEPLRRFRRLPAEFTDLVDACLEPEPRQRPTAAGVTRTLNTFI